MRTGGLTRAIKGYKGGPIVRTALQLTPYLYQRPGNLRMMEWAELNLDGALWTCSGQVISDSLIGFFDVDSRSKALGDKLPSFE